jgi:hypothetical protein
MAWDLDETDIGTNRHYRYYDQWSKVYDPPGSKFLSVHQTAGLDSHYVKSRKGNDNPIWKKQVARHEQAGTAFIGILQSATVPSYFLQKIMVKHPNVINPGQAYACEQIAHGRRPLPDVNLDPSLISEVKANNQALSRMVKKIDDLQRSFQGGVFAGELLQTLRLIRHPGKILRISVDRHHQRVEKHVRRYLRQLRSSNKTVRNSALRDTLGFASDTWLEAQLGWAPLLSDIDSAMETLADNNSRATENEYVEQRAFGFTESEIDRGSFLIGKDPGPGFQTEWVLKKTCFVRYIAMVDEGSYSALNMRRIGISPRDFFPTIYELIPYSFVIDYFTNLGTIVSSLSLRKSAVRWTMKLVRKEYVREAISFTPVLGNNGGGTYDISLGACAPPKGLKSVYREVTRSPYSESLVPGLVFNLPGSSTKWLNIAGLITNRKRLKSYFT